MYVIEKLERAALENPVQTKLVKKCETRFVPFRRVRVTAERCVRARGGATPCHPIRLAPFAIVVRRGSGGRGVRRIGGRGRGRGRRPVGAEARAGPPPPPSPVKMGGRVFPRKTRARAPARGGMFLAASKAGGAGSARARGGGGRGARVLLVAAASSGGARVAPSRKTPRRSSFPPRTLQERYRDLHEYRKAEAVEEGSPREAKVAKIAAEGDAAGAGYEGGPAPHPRPPDPPKDEDSFVASWLQSSFKMPPAEGEPEPEPEPEAGCAGSALDLRAAPLPLHRPHELWPRERAPSPPQSAPPPPAPPAPHAQLPPADHKLLADKLVTEIQSRSRDPFASQTIFGTRKYVQRYRSIIPDWLPATEDLTVCFISVSFSHAALRPAGTEQQQSPSADSTLSERSLVPFALPQAQSPSGENPVADRNSMLPFALQSRGGQSISERTLEECWTTLQRPFSFPFPRHEKDKNKEQSQNTARKASGTRCLFISCFYFANCNRKVAYEARPRKLLAFEHLRGASDDKWDRIAVNSFDELGNRLANRRTCRTRPRANTNLLQQREKMRPIRNVKKNHNSDITTWTATSSNKRATISTGLVIMKSVRKGCGKIEGVGDGEIEEKKNLVSQMYFRDTLYMYLLLINSCSFLKVQFGDCEFVNETNSSEPRLAVPF
ncbi:hypothetical protein EVAR_14598_1 [Eumeta japonica]|uniref:Uncharacterized protein n=1 Tax=Eumeta variegata TaxID=151549 RepID=A0A4C1UV18_EUMVA|nr:hypothetical protein EVAR_14598_1 [Eumeta japonica]